jgi:hypothetical protein
LNLEDGQATVLVMLDFPQTFDMIAHDLMECKTIVVVFCWGDGFARLILRSDGEYSTVRGIEYGVLQGFVLGPLLFISFIDDVSGVIYFFSNLC